MDFQPEVLLGSWPRVSTQAKTDAKGKRRDHLHPNREFFS